MRRSAVALFGILAVTISVGAMAAPEALHRYNVVWNSPSADARGSMPIGNGDIGLNLWVEPSGDLCFFIGKSDAWDVNMRLLKLNKVRVTFDPPLSTSAGFRQELRLLDGSIVIEDGKLRIRVWVDANHPVIQIDADSLSGQSVAATATLEPWRKEKRSLGKNAPGGGGAYFATGFTALPAYSYPDVILPQSQTQVGWYQRNVDSPWLPSLKLQKNEAIAQTQKDPILHLTSGGIMRGDGFVSVSATEMKSAKPAAALSLRIHALTKIADTAEAWVADVEKQGDAVEKIPAAERLTRHRQWWAAFWDRSWIHITGSSSRAVPVNQHPWRRGMDANGGSRFGGTIADAAIVGRALSVGEVAAAAVKPRTDVESIDGAAADLAGGCTAMAWIKPAPGEGGRILDKCTVGGADGVLLDTVPGLSLRWIVGTQIMTHPNCLRPGEWQHVAATVDTGTGTRRIYLDGKLVKEEVAESDAASVTRGYVLQRWINACGGRGGAPIKFNGAIFTVDNAYSDPDHRNWGGSYWAQNTRMIYWPMLACGDFDLMQAWFDLYVKALPARKVATKVYYGHDGAFFPETFNIWGNYQDESMGYGLDRTGHPDGFVVNPYIRYHWQGGIETVAMMLDYYDLTQDRAFRDRILLPFATEIVTFFDQHWKRGEDGKIRMNPSQSLETWWDCTNPMPEVAGLRFVIPRLQQIAGTKIMQKTLDDLPPVPLSADGKRLLPAEKFAHHGNIERPELYAIFPYRLYGVGKPGLDVALATLGGPSGEGCWHQEGIQSALVGQADWARRNAVGRAAARQPDFRFPAFWNQGHDWMPDQCHGGGLMTALQYMLLQWDGDRILLLPAWPKEWDVDFKLHAPRQTTVECEVRDGKVIKLIVTPESRRKDVVMGEPE
jgi:hypothetical protein